MKLEINHRKRNEKKLITWRLNNMLLKKNSGSMRKSRRKLKKYLETNDNEDTTTQNLWDATKVVLRGKFIATQASSKKRKNLKLIFYYF